MLIDEEGNQVKHVFGPFFEGELFLCKNKTNTQCVNFRGASHVEL